MRGAAGSASVVASITILAIADMKKRPESLSLRDANISILRAGDEIRTRDIQLGKLTLYH